MIRSISVKAAVRKEIQISPQDLSSLENNLIVVEVLESAVKSAERGKVILSEKINFLRGILLNYTIEPSRD